ncbi:MAG: hypothetical protein K2X59_06070 [Sphingomonas sp.]|nr:hypothetical protein [Sphingomonas sp.]
MAGLIVHLVAHLLGILNPRVRGKEYAVKMCRIGCRQPAVLRLFNAALAMVDAV